VQIQRKQLIIITEEMTKGKKLEKVKYLQCADLTLEKHAQQNRKTLTDIIYCVLSIDYDHAKLSML